MNITCTGVQYIKSTAAERTISLYWSEMNHWRIIFTEPSRRRGEVNMKLQWFIEDQYSDICPIWSSGLKICTPCAITILRYTSLKMRYTSLRGWISHAQEYKMIEKPKNGVSHPKNYLLKKCPPKLFFKKLFFWPNYIDIMIEKPKNGVSHPKNDLLKKICPPNFFF